MHPRAFCLAFAPLLFAAAPAQPVPPDWSLPGSATHHQVPPPAGFHRPTVTWDKPIGIFDGQSDVGGPLLAGHAWYYPDTGRYVIRSAGYNIWYFRDEFHFLWKRMRGNVTLAADIAFENPAGYEDRKVVLIMRQDLDDNGKEVMVALHGRGLIHLAYRPAKGADIKEAFHIDHRTNGRERLGIEKRGDTYALLLSLEGEPLHVQGPTVDLHLRAPFYVGIGFCSHQPVTPDTAIVSRVTLVNTARDLP